MFLAKLQVSEGNLHGMRDCSSGTAQHRRQVQRGMRRSPRHATCKQAASSARMHGGRRMARHAGSAPCISALREQPFPGIGRRDRGSSERTAGTCLQPGLCRLGRVHQAARALLLAASLLAALLSCHHMQLAAALGPGQCRDSCTGAAACEGPTAAVVGMVGGKHAMGRLMH